MSARARVLGSTNPPVLSELRPDCNYPSLLTPNYTLLFHTVGFTLCSFVATVTCSRTAYPVDESSSINHLHHRRVSISTTCTQSPFSNCNHKLVTMNFEKYKFVIIYVHNKAIKRWSNTLILFYCAKEKFLKQL